MTTPAQRATTHHGVQPSYGGHHYGVVAVGQSASVTGEYLGSDKHEPDRRRQEEGHRRECREFHSDWPGHHNHCRTHHYVQQALDRANPTSTLRDKAIQVSRKAGAEEDGNRPPQREVADQDPLHHILGNPLRRAGTVACLLWTICQTSRPNRRSRSELVTTLTEENPIAAPATIGFSTPSAASGIAAVL